MGPGGSLPSRRRLGRTSASSLQGLSLLPAENHETCVAPARKGSLLLQGGHGDTSLPGTCWVMAEGMALWGSGGAAAH